MEVTKEKIVEYEKYCSQCKFHNLGESEEPCNECLTWPVNLYSHKPIKFKKGTTKHETAIKENLDKDQESVQTR